MLSFLGHFLLVGIIFAVIDAVWIGLIANKFYKSQMGDLLLAKPKFVPAIIFYLLYVWGIIVFVLDPGLTQHDMGFVVTRGLLLGAVMYATYDLTNLSTLKKWPVKITIVDMIWGSLVTTISVTIAYLIVR